MAKRKLRNDQQLLPKSIRPWLKEVMEEKDWVQTQLAHELSIAQSTFSRVMRGEATHITHTKLRGIEKWAAANGKTPPWMMDGPAQTELPLEEKDSAPAPTTEKQPSLQDVSAMLRSLHRVQKVSYRELASTAGTTVSTIRHVRDNGEKVTDRTVLKVWKALEEAYPGITTEHQTGKLPKGEAPKKPVPHTQRAPAVFIGHTHIPSVAELDMRELAIIDRCRAQLPTPTNGKKDLRSS